MAKFPTIEEFVKQSVDLALDEFEYEGKTIREWTELILNGNLKKVVRCKDCKYGEIDDEDFPDQYLCKHNGCDWNKGEHFCSYGERR